MSRIIVYTGKGGVGKTSVAAASALRAAQAGYRTLVMSTDAAHSLADSLDRPLGPDPVPVRDNLWGQEIEVFHTIERYWGTIQRYVASVFAWRGIDTVMAEEMSVLPGMDELASLIWIAEHHDHGDYDLIVVDAAPTGETLRLLSLPEAGKWWLEKIYPVQRKIAGLTGPIIGRVVGMPMPKGDVWDAGEELFHRLERMHELLSDPEKSSVRVVLNLEKMVIKEAQRALTYFHLYGYPTDLVIANRILPDDAGEYFGAWREAQRRYWPLVEEAFAPIPIRTAPFFQEEVLGERMLELLGTALFGEDDPLLFYFRGRPYAVRRAEDGFVLELELPFVSKDAVSLSRFGDELVVQVGAWRRNLILPRALVELPTGAASFEGSVLRIRFPSDVKAQGATGSDRRGAAAAQAHGSARASSTANASH